MNVKIHLICCCGVLFLMTSLTTAIEPAKEEVDKLIEDEITNKLSEDLLQSIEKKFYTDLERSVDMVLVKIKMLLQNGTIHIQDRLLDLQGLLDVMKKEAGSEVEICLLKHQNQTSALAEKALHQMVVCGYALVGYDPAQAVKAVMNMKNMIKEGVTPIQSQKREVYNVLKLCGHEHDSLKKVIKCVISKSPIIKTTMMEITGKLIEGVVDLTKLMAHGAMHEACLIEVIKTVEDEAFELVDKMKMCVYGNSSDVIANVNNYIEENNATVLDIHRNIERDEEIKIDGNNKEVKEMKDLIRRMLADDNNKDLDKRFKKKLVKLQKDLRSVDDNVVDDNVVDDNVKKDK